MRRALVAALVLTVAGGPAWAAKTPPPVNPDPLTASGRFDLPQASTGAYAGRVKLGSVRLDPAMATQSKLDGAALTTAVRTAAERSLTNFGYLADAEATDPLVVDLELLPVTATKGEGGLDTVVRLQFKPNVDDACLAAVGEGRFKALDRERSGGGRRAFAIGATVALAFVLVNAGGFMATELQTASAENKARNGLRHVAAGEGVSPDFSEVGQFRYAATSAVQLAFADYIRQLGASEACKTSA